ncbi:hypothetical protein BESB_058600 [Besnoitia besnoiti]|uniref:Uncharacterized protein n=1 Tax=Besnoitia besnoiti TaxID=94643 RepID=A0A2A9MH36_BESBE|nr:hypothetical protein BESB_058600 [Besnoitia besnoiti]PFH34973.1 hypothetical protein BESB_058600 [Besnoitia besnoiti]
MEPNARVHRRSAQGPSEASPPWATSPSEASAPGRPPVSSESPSDSACVSLPQLRELLRCIRTSKAAAQQAAGEALLKNGRRLAEIRRHLAGDHAEVARLRQVYRALSTQILGADGEALHAAVEPRAGKETAEARRSFPERCEPRDGAAKGQGRPAASSAPWEEVAGRPEEQCAAAEPGVAGQASASADSPRTPAPQIQSFVETVKRRLEKERDLEGRIEALAEAREALDGLLTRQRLLDACRALLPEDAAAPIAIARGPPRGGRLREAAACLRQFAELWRADHASPSTSAELWARFAALRSPQSTAVPPASLPGAQRAEATPDSDDVLLDLEVGQLRLAAALRDGLLASLDGAFSDCVRLSSRALHLGCQRHPAEPETTLAGASADAAKGPSAEAKARLQEVWTAFESLGVLEERVGTFGRKLQRELLTPLIEVLEGGCGDREGDAARGSVCGVLRLECGVEGSACRDAAASPARVSETAVSSSGGRAEKKEESRAPALCLTWQWVCCSSSAAAGAALSCGSSRPVAGSPGAAWTPSAGPALAPSPSSAAVSSAFSAREFSCARRFDRLRFACEAMESLVAVVASHVLLSHPSLLARFAAAAFPRAFMERLLANFLPYAALRADPAAESLSGNERSAESPPTRKGEEARGEAEAEAKAEDRSEGAESDRIVETCVEAALACVDSDREKAERANGRTDGGVFESWLGLESSKRRQAETLASVMTRGAKRNVQVNSGNLSQRTGDSMPSVEDVCLSAALLFRLHHSLSQALLPHASALHAPDSACFPAYFAAEFCETARVRVESLLLNARVELLRRARAAWLLFPPVESGPEALLRGLLLSQSRYHPRYRSDRELKPSKAGAEAEAPEEGKGGGGDGWPPLFVAVSDATELWGFRALVPALRHCLSSWRPPEEGALRYEVAVLSRAVCGNLPEGVMGLAPFRVAAGTHFVVSRLLASLRAAAESLRAERDLPASRQGSSTEVCDGVRCQTRERDSEASCSWGERQSGGADDGDAGRATASAARVRAEDKPMLDVDLEASDCWRGRPQWLTRVHARRRADALAWEAVGLREAARQRLVEIRDLALLFVTLRCADPARHAVGLDPLACAALYVDCEYFVQHLLRLPLSFSLFFSAAGGASFAASSSLHAPSERRGGEGSSEAAYSPSVLAALKELFRFSLARAPFSADGAPLSAPPTLRAASTSSGSHSAASAATRGETPTPLEGLAALSEKSPGGRCGDLLPVFLVETLGSIKQIQESAYLGMLRREQEIYKLAASRIFSASRASLARDGCGEERASGLEGCRGEAEAGFDGRVFADFHLAHAEAVLTEATRHLRQTAQQWLGILPQQVYVESVALLSDACMQAFFSAFSRLLLPLSSAFSSSSFGTSLPATSPQERTRAVAYLISFLLTELRAVFALHMDSPRVSPSEASPLLETVDASLEAPCTARIERFVEFFAILEAMKVVLETEEELLLQQVWPHYGQILRQKVDEKTIDRILSTSLCLLTLADTRCASDAMRQHASDIARLLLQT